MVDDKVDRYFGSEIDSYFAAKNIQFTKLGFSGNDVDKASKTLGGSWLP